MKLPPFELERWLQEPCEYDIASAGITKLVMHPNSRPETHPSSMKRNSKAWSPAAFRRLRWKVRAMM